MISNSSGLRILFAGLSLLLFGAYCGATDLCAQTPVNPSKEPSIFATNSKEYVYKEVNGVKLSLDVIDPANFDPSKPQQAIIFFHGGGWNHGDKRGLEYHCRYFVERGLIVVTANYRFIDKKATTAPANSKALCVEDGKSAIRWVRSHATELGIDPNRIIFGGESAGTEIALVSAMNTTLNDPADDTSIPTTAQAFILYNPALTIISVHNPEDPQIEPYVYISPSMPPSILFCGSKDGWKTGADRFLSDCKAAGVKSEMWVALDQEHAFTKKEEWVQATSIKADEFLVAQGILPKGDTTPVMPPNTTLLTPDEYKASLPIKTSPGNGP